MTIRSMSLARNWKPSRHWRLAIQLPPRSVNESGAEQMSDAALLRQESRKLSALSTQVWDAAERKIAKLVRSRTGELALLIQALALSSQAAIDALLQAEKMQHAPPLSGGVARQGNETVKF
jgi:hypothetical protein